MILSTTPMTLEILMRALVALDESIQETLHAIQPIFTVRVRLEIHLDATK